MGRGRAKAKQTKVARDLKYSSPQTDFTQLQRELSGGEDDRLIGRDVQSDDGGTADDDEWRP